MVAARRCSLRWAADSLSRRRRRCTRLPDDDESKSPSLCDVRALVDLVSVEEDSLFLRLSFFLLSHGVGARPGSL